MQQADEFDKAKSYGRGRLRAVYTSQDHLEC